MNGIVKTFSFGVGGVVALLAVGMMFPRAAHALVATLIQNVDEPGRNPFALQAVFSSNAYASFQVPAGKRYVIEEFGGYCQTDGSSLTSITLDAQTGTNITRAYAWAFLFSGADWAASAVTRQYADQSTLIYLQGNSAATLAGCSFTVSGYSVNTP